MYYRNKMIVLTGVKGAGKDTLANVVLDKLDRYAFGDMHKRMCSSVIPWLDDDYTSEEKDSLILRNGMTPREIWKMMNVVTEIYPRINVHKLEDLLTERDYSTSKGVIITDLRKIEEYEWVRDKNATIIRITDVSELPSNVDLDDDDIFTAWVDADIEFYNDKTPQSLIDFGLLIDRILNDSK